MRYPKVSLPGSLLALCLLSLALCLGSMLTSCSEWNTDALGSHFVPANSQVRNFTHLVYVEYGGDGVRIWGNSAQEVTSTVEGQHVSIQNASDSLALFVYGYPTAQDTLATSDASLVVSSQVPYALYLGGLGLRNQQGQAIQCVGDGACYLVLPQGSKNHLWGSLDVEGPLYVTGRGSLTIDHAGTCLTAASLQCQYDATITLDSRSGDGISLRGPMRSTLGTWTINAQRHGIYSPDSVMLMAGTYQGTAVEGAFIEARHGVIVRRPTLMAAAAWNSDVLDSAYVAQRHDSVLGVWHQPVDTLDLEARATYQVFRQGSKTATASFTPLRSIAQPWLLIAHTAIQSTDTLSFVAKSADKK